MAVASLLYLSPLAFMVAGSLRAPGLAPPAGFEWLPEAVRIENYRSVFALIPLWTQIRNSLIVVAVAVPITVVIASWAGFAIATAARRRQTWLVAVSLLALMVPSSALWVPRFVLFKWAGLTDTFVPLVAPALMATTPFYVLLFALTYVRLPHALYEAARLEGLSPPGIWRRVAWPLGRPTTFAVAVLAFVFHWANFIDPLLYLSGPELYTVPLGLRALQTLEPANHPILLAASVMVTLPAVVAFVAVQRAFFSKTLRV